jgi:hypothetical protein
VAVFYWLALVLRWPSPKNGAIAIAVTSLATVGDSLNKGLLRILGTAIGVAAGLLILTTFAQSRWGFMLAMAAYVMAVSYVLQNSRHGYAWFLAGMTATTVWSSSYLNSDDAFQIGLFRFVETAGGVAVYSIVSLVLWPRSAGTQVDDAGRQLLRDVGKLFQLERTSSPDAKELGASLAGSLAKFEKVLVAATSDTPSMRARKDSWRSLPADLRSFGDALQLWRLSIADVRELDRDRVLLDADCDLDLVARRLDRVVDLWDTREKPEPVDDDDLLSPLPLATCDTRSLSHGDRARLMNHVHDLRRVDESSRALLRRMRALARLEDPAPERAAAEHRARWDPERLFAALFPALCFVVAYLFWIYTNPPAGNGIAILGVAFGMVLLLVPMNLFKILKVLLLGIAVASLLYMFVLPRLENGAALLALVFTSTFLLGLLRGRLAALRTLGLVAFALITNITSRQSYSFLGVLYPAIMMILGTSIVMAVYWFISPMQPDKVVPRTMRRFFRGCTRVMRGFAGDQPEERALRRRSFRYLILPAGPRLRGAQQSLDYKQFPSNTPERVKRLSDSVQLITFRLQALDHAFERFVAGCVEIPGTLAVLRETLATVFSQWVRSPGTPALAEQRATLERQSLALRDELDRIGDEAQSDDWAVIGGLRGLVEAMAETQDAMRDIRWDEWAVARF